MCIQRVTIRSKKTGQLISVPCGNCAECLENRRSEWSFRLQQELKLSHSAYFVTLTYSNENIPADGNLNKRHCQNFIKRLRRANEKYSPNKLRYYLAGEYGDKTERPHYHMIIFNMAKMLLGKLDTYVDLETGEIKERCTQLESIWAYGNIYIGKVEPASIHYTTGYILQKQDTGKKEKPFALMSKRPPLGIGYLTDEMRKYHQENSFITFEGGYKKTMPRTFSNKLYNDAQKVQNRMENLQEKHKIDIKLRKKYKSEYRTRKEAIEQYKKFKLKQKLKAKHND